MKKLILSVFTILMVSAATFGATQALFSDEETSSGNTFTAGSLNLELLNPVSVPFSVSNIKPGDEGEGQVTLSNTGNLPGNLNIVLDNFVQDENGCIEPEIKAGDPCGAGDLDLAFRMAMFLDANGDGVYNQADGDIELEYSGNTNTSPGLQFARASDFVGKVWSDDLLTDLPNGLESGSDMDLVIQWKFLNNSYAKPDAIFMTDSLSFDITFVLEQLN